MSRKSASSGNRRAEPAGDGMVAELIDRVFENPAMSGGLMVVALTATAIVSNAMFLQNGHHPDPLFMSRPSQSAVRNAPQPVVTPVPRPRPQLQLQPPPLVDVPLPRISPRHAQPEPQLAEPPVVEVAEPTADNAAQVLTEIQRELARLGLYSGTIDGTPGPKTSAAIAAYQTAAGLRATGLASPELLDAIKAPLPPRAIPGMPTAADDTAGNDAIAAELDQREKQRAASIAAEQKTRAEALMHQNYRIVQGALNRIGYGPIAVDGSPSTETADAIRRFELDNGLPITGEASDSLIGRMIAIGAIKAT